MTSIPTITTGVAPPPQGMAIPTTIPPQPLPTAVGAQQVQAANGVMLVRVSVCSPCGVFVFFCDPQMAKTLGAQLSNLGDAGNLLLAASVG